MDLYLSPHSDDICFSLGGLAHRRQRVMLLTILPISGYVPTHPDRAPPPADQGTATRMGEAARFAAACGLSARFLNLSDAPYLGHASRDLRWVEQNVERIEPALMKVLSN